MSDNIILSRMGRVPAGFENVLDGYQHIFGSTECSFFSAPGRTEICGNHLDHQHGCVIAAAVGLDIKAAAGMRDDKVVHIYSEGFGEIITDIADTEVREEEYGTVNSLIRGIAAAFKGQGLEVSGFNAYIQSSVPSGSGVSSSAAFEVLIGNIFMEMSKADHEPGDSLPEKRKLADAVNIARAGQYAENRYFGKPSGLMDQLACSVGGIIYMDLKCPDDPEVIPIDAGSCLEGYSICLVNTGSSHADLTGDYASVSEEMHRAASALGQDVLRDVKREDFYSRIPYLRDAAGDRALLRAAHFFDEMDRVKEAAEALKAGDTKYFLSIVNASGDSSYKLLQNIYPQNGGTEQSLALALHLAGRVLEGRGAVRVHGGGFAGTIQSYVPDDLLQEYVRVMEDTFGNGCVYILKVREYGGIYLG